MQNPALLEQERPARQALAGLASRHTAGSPAPSPAPRRRATDPRPPLGEVERLQQLAHDADGAVERLWTAFRRARADERGGARAALDTAQAMLDAIAPELAALRVVLAEPAEVTRG